MSRSIAIARQRGIGEIDGEVLQENGPMLKMCREVGFTITARPADPGAIAVGKRLNGDGFAGSAGRDGIDPDQSPFKSDVP